jgi:hypothetical protein
VAPCFLQGRVEVGLSPLTRRFRARRVDGLMLATLATGAGGIEVGAWYGFGQQAVATGLHG